MLAKREPATAPSVMTAALPSHHGSVAWTNPVPCRIAEPAIAPNSSPPGKPHPEHERARAAVDTATSTASSDERRAGSRRRRRASGARRRAEQRQPGGQADHDQQHAHDMHDGDAADIAP